MTPLESNKQSELDKLLKGVCLKYFYLIIIISSIFSAYYIYHKINPLNYIVLVCPIVHIFLFAIPYRLPYKSIKPLISVYLIYISVFLYANLIVFWSLGQVTAFMWYSLIPVACMLFFKRKTVIIWVAYVVLHICSIFILIPFLDYDFSNTFTGQQLVTVNIMTILFSICFIAFFLYYLNKMNTIKLLQIVEEHQLEKQEKVTTTKENVETDNLKKLYNEILRYFLEKKPYSDPDFTIVQLAKDLNSNVKYIASAIKRFENVNFKIFVNRYRIDMIKELIAKDYHNKYTIRHMYYVAGFRHQSTFNKVFKDIEGITPTEYIKVDRVKRMSK